jgi:tetratricopeptide (TPR) repeat protein
MTGLFKKEKQSKGTKFLKTKKIQLKKLVKEKKYDLVFQIGEEILKKNPDDMDVLFILGGLFYMRGKFAKAISHFDRLLETSSYDPEALLLKAKSHYSLGQFTDSKNCCNKILEIDPKNKEISELLQKIVNNSN